MPDGEVSGACRCGSGMLRLFVVGGVPACPRCVRWTLLQSNAAVWRSFGVTPAADSRGVKTNATGTTRRRLQLVAT